MPAVTPLEEIFSIVKVCHYGRELIFRIHPK